MKPFQVLILEKDLLRVQLELEPHIFELLIKHSCEEVGDFLTAAFEKAFSPVKPLGDKVQALIRPDTLKTKTIARLYINGKTIQIQFPEKLDEFREVVKGLLYEWSNGYWQRTFESDAAMCDRASEIAHSLLDAGFAIQVEHSEVRDRAINGEFEPESFRKIKCGAQKPYVGWFVFDYPRDEKHWYDKIIKITAAKYDSGILRVPPEHFAEVEDFAEQHDFVFSEKANEALENARSLWESALLVLPAKKKRRGATVKNQLENKDVVIPDALKDEPV